MSPLPGLTDNANEFRYDAGMRAFLVATCALSGPETLVATDQRRAARPAELPEPG